MPPETGKINAGVTDAVARARASFRIGFVSAEIDDALWHLDG
jgi:hypothetical protein